MSKKSDFVRACNYIARKAYHGKPVVLGAVTRGTKVSYSTAHAAVRHFQALKVLVPGPRLPSNGRRGAPAKQFITRAVADKLNFITG